MKMIIAAIYVLVGIINFVPVIGVLSSDQLVRLYSLGMVDADLELLLRHRAVLFGLMGALILIAAFIPSLRLLATSAGLVSMLSFVALAVGTDLSNAKLVQIAKIDIYASLVLLLGFTLHLFNR